MTAKHETSGRTSAEGNADSKWDSLTEYSSTPPELI